MFYRLIALDIDGTLLNSRNELTPAVLAAVRRVHARCSSIVLASGRNQLGVQHILDQLGLGLWVIGSGGALIRNTQSRQILQQSPLTSADARKVIQLARLGGANIFLENHNALFWEGQQTSLDQIKSVIGIPITMMADMEQILDVDPLKITLMQENAILLQVEKALRPQAPNLNLTYSMPIYLEITRRGVNKGVALRFLASYLQVPMEQVAAVGDGENDIYMFREAGLSIAMGNAPLVVKQAADLVTSSNDEDGLVWALEQIEAAHVSNS